MNKQDGNEDESSSDEKQNRTTKFSFTDIIMNSYQKNPKSNFEQSR
jgi:hypothetical protein